MKRFFVVFSLLLFLSCVTPPHKSPEEASKEDLKIAQDLAESGRYDLAIDKLSNLKIKYPLTKEAIEAELKMADIYFMQSSYPEAISAYESFRELHPQHKEIPYAIFRTGLAYYRDLPSTNDRDLAGAYKAIEQFNHLITLHPQSNHAGEAKNFIKECQERLVQKEIYIAKYYFKRHHWQPAIERFQDVVKKFKNTKGADEALFYLGKAYLNLKNPSSANQYFKQLVQEYPQSSFKQEAAQLIKKKTERQ